jgi:hypothetical protein
MKSAIDAAVVFLITFILFAVAWGETYTATDLGAIQPTAVIDGPVVFGNLNGAPVVWQDGQVRALEHLGHGGQVNGANNRGDAVGWVWLPSQGTIRKVASFWYPDGRVILLPGSNETEAQAVNMDRIIAGSNLTESRALRWVPGQLEEYLPASTRGRAVDGTGRVWGNRGNEPVAWDLDGTRHGFSNVGVIQAGPSGANNTIAIGWADRSPGVASAVYYAIPMAVTRLAIPDPSLNHPSCAARSINNNHVAVGQCYTRSGTDPLAMMWPDANTIINLNDVSNAPFVLEWSAGISEDGHIVGTSEGHGWLLTPIAPSVALLTNATPFGLGATLRVSVERKGIGDLHVAVILPDGQTTLFLTNMDTLSYIVSTIPRGPYPVTAGASLTHTWHALNEPGVYHFIAALARPGSLLDGKIDTGDIVALDWKAVQFVPHVASR